MNEHDKSAESAEARIARLYRDLAREEPPPHLDQAITRAARQPARTLPPATRPWWTPWRLPFAVAAVAVVSVSLVTLVLEEGGERLIEGPPASAPPVVRPETVPGEAETPSAATGAADAETERRDARRSAPASAPREQSLRDESPAASPGLEAGARAESAVAERRSRTAETAPAQSRRAAKPEAGAAQSQDTAEPVAAPPPELAAPAPAAVPEAQERAAGPLGRAASAPKPAPAPVPMRKLEREAAVSQPAQAIATEIAGLQHEPPAAWIERMLALQRAGRDAEARALAAEFRKRFPAVALPAEIR